MENTLNLFLNKIYTLPYYPEICFHKAALVSFMAIVARMSDVTPAGPLAYDFILIH